MPSGDWHAAAAGWGTPYSQNALSSRAVDFGGSAREELLQRGHDVFRLLLGDPVAALWDDLSAYVRGERGHSLLDDGAEESGSAEREHRNGKGLLRALCVVLGVAEVGAVVVECAQPARRGVGTLVLVQILDRESGRVVREVPVEPVEVHALTATDERLHDLRRVVEEQVPYRTTEPVARERDLHGPLVPETGHDHLHDRELADGMMGCGVRVGDSSAEVVSGQQHRTDAEMAQEGVQVLR